MLISVCFLLFDAQWSVCHFHLCHFHCHCQIEPLSLSSSLSDWSTCKVRKTDEQTVETKKSCRNVSDRKIRKTKKMKVLIAKVIIVNGEERKRKNFTKRNGKILQNMQKSDIWNLQLYSRTGEITLTFVEAIEIGEILKFDQNNRYLHKISITSYI